MASKLALNLLLFAVAVHGSHGYEPYCSGQSLKDIILFHIINRLRIELD